MRAGLNGYLGPFKGLSGLCWVLDTDVSDLRVWNRDAAAVSPEIQAATQTGGGVWKDRNPSSFDPTICAGTILIPDFLLSFVCATWRVLRCQEANLS